MNISLRLAEYDRHGARRDRAVAPDPRRHLPRVADPARQKNEAGNLKKSDRKTENKIARALRSVCDELMFKTTGFCWLTHFVDYTNVPQSLRIVCVFDTRLAMESVRNEEVTRIVAELAEIYLEKEGLFIPQIERAVFLDAEEIGADVGSSSWCRKYSYRESNH